MSSAGLQLVAEASLIIKVIPFGWGRKGIGREGMEVLDGRIHIGFAFVTVDDVHGGVFLAKVA